MQKNFGAVIKTKFFISFFFSIFSLYSLPLSLSKILKLKEQSSLVLRIWHELPFWPLSIIVDCRLMKSKLPLKNPKAFLNLLNHFFVLVFFLLKVPKIPGFKTQTYNSSTKKASFCRFKMPQNLLCFSSSHTFPFH